VSDEPGVPGHVMDALGLGPSDLTPLGGLSRHNANWRVTLDGRDVVLRRHRPDMTVEELEWERNLVAWLSDSPWTVPTPIGDVIRDDQLWSVNTMVAGACCSPEPDMCQEQRGRVLAQLHVTLRGRPVEQRPLWNAAHLGRPVRGETWDPTLSRLRRHDPQLSDRFSRALKMIEAELAGLEAHDLPLIPLHGDFAEWNVHYEDGKLTGVIDFDLAHVDSRPYELAIARAYRAPVFLNAYSNELERLGWPLTERERRAIDPIHRLFRLNMVGAEILDGSGEPDWAFVQLQMGRAE